MAEQFVECPNCGQQGNRPPGLKLGEYENLEAVIVPLDERLDQFATLTASKPQRITCRNCGYSWPVPRDSIKTRKPREGTAEMPANTEESG